MASKVCLLIIYNHRYDANIDKLEKIYASRFTDIYHIMPFYTGTKENVIPVYECSFRFEGYVAQAMKQISEKYEYYFFVADDIVLNPSIDETNYKEWFSLKDNRSFITFTKPIREMKDWALRRSFMDPLPKFEWYNGTIWKDEIMSAEQAFDIAQKKGVGRDEFCVDLGMVWKARKNIKKYPRLFVLFFKILMLGKQYCPYPVWGGYSDIFIVPGKKIYEFSHMLGVFAAMNLFVEMAIPTAMNLLFEDLVEEKELETKARVLWSNEDRDGIEKKYERNYNNLIGGWEENCLYIHPVKLSRWEV